MSNTLNTSNAQSLSAVDLSNLPFPEFLADADYEKELAQMLADTNGFSIKKTGQPYIVHEADPAYIVIEACAYRLWLKQLDYQNQVKQMLVAYASGAMLDQLGANPDFKCVRLTIIPADLARGIAAAMESDDDYRARLVLSNEGYTTAGSGGAYLFHALSADSDVRDISVYSPEKSCTVYLTVLSWSNGGHASQALIDKVNTYVSASEKRPLSDYVITRAAQIISYNVSATIDTYPGADIPDTVARATASVQAYVAAHTKIDHDITRAGIIAAAMVVGVQNVDVQSPSADLVTDNASARMCVGVAIVQREVAL